MKNKEFNKRLIQLVLPITLQNFMFALVPVADAVMLVVLDQDAMSAVSLATQVTFFLNLFIFAITSGASMFAAQFWGDQDLESMEKLYGFVMKITIPIVVVFFAVTFLAPEMVMRIFTSEDAIVAYGISYLKIASFSYILMCLAQIIEVFMKNTNLVKSATVISIIMVFVNIGLNAVFIYGLFGLRPMETAGAALATTISSGVGFVMAVLVQLIRGRVRFRIRHFFSTPKNIWQNYLRYTSPIFFNQLGWGTGFTMISVIMGHLGSDAVAANSIVAVVKDLISCFCFALSSGGAIMVGNELGAGRLEQGKEYGGKLCRLALYSGIVSGLIVLAFAPIISKNVNISEQASHYLFWMLVMCVYYMVGRSMNSTVIAGIFAAGGDTKFGFICDTVTMWGFIVPVGALAAFVLKLPVLAVFFILNLDEIVKLPAVYKHYKRYRWVKNLAQEVSDLADPNSTDFS
ncbi:MAG: MATE family efflux transporter [Lachnospiraceae bacterium]|nr:MATE family efflux transporter [Lachnospiraceae bacterium]